MQISNGTKAIYNGIYNCEVVSQLLLTNSKTLECLEGSQWEKDFCNSIMRNFHLLNDARIQDTRNTFTHAINV